MNEPLLTIVETKAYIARAKARLTEEERTDIIDMIADAPGCGIDLGGGLFKVRYGIGGRGKSGGARVIYLYRNAGMPVFLLTVFAKNEKSNLTAKETNVLIKVADQIAATYGA